MRNEEGGKEFELICVIRVKSLRLCVLRVLALKFETRYLVSYGERLAGIRLRQGYGGQAARPPKVGDSRSSSLRPWTLDLRL
jgi:hypothetical protein